MGPAFVLLAYVVVGSVLAGVGAAVTGGVTALLTRGAPKGRRRALIAAILFPFAGLAWSLAVLLVSGIINESVLHRDLGFGDTWQTPLPNGYQLLMIDVTDHGWVYNPKTQGHDAVATQEDAVDGVRIMQVAGPYILGGTGSQSYDDEDKIHTDRVDNYFLLDTQTGNHLTFTSLESLAGATAPLGINLNLERIDVVYSRYRYTWFDKLIIFVLCTPPLIFAGLIVWWIVLVRRTRRTVPSLA